MRPSHRRMFGVWLGAAVIGAMSGAVSGGLILSGIRLPAPITLMTPRVAPESDAAVSDLVERVLPSVVSIDITQKQSTSTRRVALSDILHLGGGSGFFISADGLVVTNRHVISDTNVDYTVITQDGRELSAKVLALDPSFDLGVLKIENTSDTFPAIELGDSDKLHTGQTVIAIGNALAEFQNSVTKGIVSGLNRRLYAGDETDGELIEEAIQTDAAINPGNSGGPLITLDGKVVGMNTAISDGAQSLGFALPSSVLAHAVDSVRVYGRIVRPWIGVRYTQVEEKPFGALIQAAEPGSPADKAGLVKDDVILEMDGEAVGDIRSLGSLVARHVPGDTVTLKVLRKGAELQIPLTLAERPSDIK